MAQLTQQARLRERIDRYQAYLLKAWQGVPELAAEWPGWDEHSRLAFDLDWGVCEDRLAQLQQWAEEGRLDPLQRARFDQLQALVARHRPLLESLLRE